MYNAYDKSEIWSAQLSVIQNDLQRMPAMNHDNVIKLIKRHAATSPWHPYTQGHLYLIYTMGYVLRDEQSLFWGYSQLCNILYKYGPDNRYGTKVVPDWVVVGNVPEGLDTYFAGHCIGLRWVYVMFGQTFTTPETICAVWDYLLFDTRNIHCMCAALLQHASHTVARKDDECLLEYWSNILSIQIDTTETAAALIACAQKIHE